MQQTFQKVKAASREMGLISDEKKDQVLCAVADAILARKGELLMANTEDLSRMDRQNPLYDRLQLTEKRLEDIAADMRHVSELPSPLGRTLLNRTLPNGLQLRKVSVPFGVIGVVYEARPNVTFDVFSLCFKSGNACVLKGGKDADNSNRAAIRIIHDVLRQQGLNSSFVELLPASHEATAQMLSAVGYIDVCIPRGSKRLIQFVRESAQVPVIETGAGVVNTYFDEYGDLNMGTAIVLNAKTRRVSVCNALDCLIIHEGRLKDLAALCAPLADKQVLLFADAPVFVSLQGKYPSELLRPATEESYGTEFMSYTMAIKTVSCMEDALEHIYRYGSGHSESIVTENEERAQLFQAQVDAACVYVNAPTSFTDGAQFGLGAEIGISTQKLGPRGPMGLEEMTTYKWLINGKGQTRP
ncbi:MAG: glutamate-5-semialdehyde dehydrogenase [Bacteroidaceae bacterium]|nr:glutamate-5-semialdehyde dehydrogenase [Bacteroidaceae bacterium]